MSAEANPLVSKTSLLEWYENPAKLRQKREELGVSVARLAKIIGRHPSYIEEIESGRIPLVWEDGGELLWSHLIEIQLSAGQTVPLSQALEAPYASVRARTCWMKSDSYAKSRIASTK